jgi:hypothetical protein
VRTVRRSGDGEADGTTMAICAAGDGDDWVTAAMGATSRRIGRRIVQKPRTKATRITTMDRTRERMNRYAGGPACADPPLAVT